MKKILIVVAALGIIFFGINIYNAQKVKEVYDSIHMSFFDYSEIEYGSNFLGSDMIEDYDGDIIKITEVDTKVLGEQVIQFTLEKEGVERVFEKTITVVDTYMPNIELNAEAVTIYKDTTYDLNSNVKNAYDEVDGELEVEFSGSVDTSKTGEYVIKVTTKDANGNTAEKEFTVTVKEKKVNASGYPEETPSDVQPYYVNGILLINKNHPVPSTFGGKNATAENAFKKMAAAAKEEGLDLWVRTSYRSYSNQKDIYNGWVAKYGVEKADTISARPGYSEHHSGLAFDIISLSVSFADTPEGQWLAAHCAEYGFIIRYPKGKEHITGYSYEPWHIRYVGVEHSITIMEQGLTLEEYLGVR